MASQKNQSETITKILIMLLKNYLYDVPIKVNFAKVAGFTALTGKYGR